MAEADHYFLLLDAGADVGFRLVRVVVALLDLEGDFVGAAVLGPAQRANGAGDAGVHVGAGAGDYPGGEGRRVELVLGVQVQRGVHGANPRLARLLAVQQVQEVTADGVVVGFHVDTLAVVAEVVPVEQRGAQAGHQLVGDIASTRMVVVFLLRGQAAQNGSGGTHDVHRVGGRRQLLQGGLDAGRQAAQGLQLGLVTSQFGDVRQLAVDQQVGDFLEFAAVGEVENVIATVVQVVTGAADGAQGGVAGGGAAQGHGLFRLEGSSGFGGSGHRGVLLIQSGCLRLVFPWAASLGRRPTSGYFLAANSASSFCSKAW
ncbi:hypothetical protein D3C85_1063830 [compost metagenome]